MLILALLAATLAVLSWPGPGGWRPRERASRVVRPATQVRSGVVLRWRPGRRPEAVLDEALAELLGLLAAPVEAGVPPAVALAAVEPSARDGPLAGLVSDLVDAAGAGRPLAAVWAGWAARWDNSSVGFVGRAWSLSEEAGAPLVDALAAAVDGVQARRRAREHLLTAVAGPRASMRVLSLLPLAGPVVGLACGVGPRALYLSSAAGTVSLALGLVLAALAAAWSRRILARAT